jgi:branched-subunit amino acid aminotransferase/4-amino-4-deoxychorismate lyase
MLPADRPVVAPASVPPFALRETCRLVRGRVPLWPRHRARLAAGGCGADLLERADREVARAAAGWDGPESSRLRLTCVVTPEGEVTSLVERRLSTLDVPGGPRLAVVEIAEPPTLPPGAAKPADRSYWDRAHRSARAAGGDIAVIATREGLVLDGSTSTVWLVLGGEVRTPSAPPAIAGVARAFLLDSLAAAGSPARVGPCTLTDLERADDVFLTNAFGGFAAVRGRGGSEAARLAREAFARLWEG